MLYNSTRKLPKTGLKRQTKGHKNEKNLFQNFLNLNTFYLIKSHFCDGFFLLPTSLSHLRADMDMYTYRSCRNRIFIFPTF